MGPLLAGLDKFFNLLTNWQMYLNPLAPRLLHIQPSTFMHIVGVIEILAGLAVLTRYTRYASYVCDGLVMVYRRKPRGPMGFPRYCRTRSRNLAGCICPSQAFGGQGGRCGAYDS